MLFLLLYGLRFFSFYYCIRYYFRNRYYRYTRATLISLRYSAATLSNLSLRDAVLTLFCCNITLPLLYCSFIPTVLFRATYYVFNSTIILYICVIFRSFDFDRKRYSRLLQHDSKMLLYPCRITRIILALALGILDSF